MTNNRQIIIKSNRAVVATSDITLYNLKGTDFG